MAGPSPDEEEITLQQYNLELSAAEAEFNSREYISSDEMLQLARKWQYTS